MKEIYETHVPALGWEDLLEEGMTTTPVFLPGESHGQGSLEGYSPQGRKELDTAQVTQYTQTHIFVGTLILCLYLHDSALIAKYSKFTQKQDIFQCNP